MAPEQISKIIQQVVVVFFLVMTIVQIVDCIGCFVCASVNGSDPACEDTFNNTRNYYKQHCMSGRQERTGMFPATACVKLKASIESEDYHVLVRACVVDDGGVNSETEIGRLSHCWFVRKIKYNDRYMYGCSVACDTDGCNHAVTTQISVAIVTISFFTQWIIT